MPRRSQRKCACIELSITHILSQDGTHRMSRGTIYDDTSGSGGGGGGGGGGYRIRWPNGLWPCSFMANTLSKQFEVGWGWTTLACDPGLLLGMISH